MALVPAPTEATIPSRQAGVSNPPDTPSPNVQVSAVPVTVTAAVNHLKSAIMYCINKKTSTKGDLHEFIVAI